MRFFKLDPMMIKLIITVLLANLIPAKGGFYYFFKYLTNISISFLFFMHGAKLSRAKIIAGSNNWKVHLCTLCSTFIFFPILGVLLTLWHPVDISSEIYTGFIYLCILPATVQSSIAFTSIAGGNVATAVCSASVSSLLGVFISPLLLNLTTNIHNNAVNNDLEHIGKILAQLLVPFVLGHLSRGWIGNYVKKNQKLINKTDQLSIILVVYSAFSEAVINGIWQKVGINILMWILIGSMILLCIILVVNFGISRFFRFSRNDEIVVLFCGSKKSLANGVPMANILFPANIVGIIILPLMIFHQIQLIICSYIAQRYKMKNHELNYFKNKNF